jgi:CBS domain-containing protein
MKIDALMTTEVLTVTPETSLKDVARLLIENRISGVPVCDAHGVVLGVVSEADILLKEEALVVRGFLASLLERGPDAEKIDARTAGQAMSAPPVTIAPGKPVSEGARLMVGRGINRLPVVDEGRLVGIVTRADLVAAFTRSDREIKHEIAEDVLLHTLWISPKSLSIDVSDGEVILGGEVESKTHAELVEAYVRRVLGVVGVDVSRLRWTFDDQTRAGWSATRRLDRLGRVADRR